MCFDEPISGVERERSGQENKSTDQKERSRTSRTKLRGCCCMETWGGGMNSRHERKKKKQREGYFKMTASHSLYFSLPQMRSSQ